MGSLVGSIGVYAFHKGDTGELLCPIPGCGHDLYLERTEIIPLDWPYSPSSIHDATANANFAAVGAVSSSWQVVCDDGHVIATPNGAEDYADFDYARFLAGKRPDGPGDGETRCAWCGAIVEGDDDNDAVCTAEDCVAKEQGRAL